MGVEAFARVDVDGHREDAGDFFARLEPVARGGQRVGGGEARSLAVFFERLARLDLAGELEHAVFARRHAGGEDEASAARRGDVFALRDGVFGLFAHFISCRAP